MFQKSRGRPRGLENDAEDAIRLLGDADWGMTHREIASRLRRSPSAIRRALLLAAGVPPGDYEQLGRESLEISQGVHRMSAAREGTVRWAPVLGGWYWCGNEAQFRERNRRERSLPSKQEQARGAYVQLWLEGVMARANRSPRTIRIFNQGARRLGGPLLRGWAEQMGFVFDPQGKIYTESLLEGVFPWWLRRFPGLTFWMRPRAANWLRRPDLVDKPNELAQELERAVRRWRRWAAQP